MASRLATTRFRAVLVRLFAAAVNDDLRGQPELPPGRTSWSDVTAAERSEAYADRYLPISEEAGNLLYALVRAIRPRTVVEFGTSFGISTLFLAAGVADNGSGEVITTELNTKKASAARANLDEAAVGDRVTILEGDALEMLGAVPGPVELALLEELVPSGPAAARTEALAGRTRRCG
jgi:hypothetical protein